MTERYQFNENLNITQNSEIQANEMRAALISTVRWWTEREMEAGRTPTFEGFIKKFVDFDQEHLYETIGEVMHRVKHSSSR